MKIMIIQKRKLQIITVEKDIRRLSSYKMIKIIIKN